MHRQHVSKITNVTDTVTRKTMPLLAPIGLPVAGAHRVEAHVLDGREVRVVVADWQAPDSVDCWPVHEPDLANDFAKVTDERSLQEFNGRYGLLGYQDLYRSEMKRRKEIWRGDPVPWALAHAKVASGILASVGIIDDVRTDKVKLSKGTLPALLRALLNQFGTMGLESLFEGDPRRFVGFVWRPPESLVDASEPRSYTKFSSRWKNDPIGTAYLVLSWVLNRYIRRIRFEFVSLDYGGRFFGLPNAGAPRLGVEIRWDALLQVVYWKLAEAVGGAFRQCPRCGLLFPMSTAKDVYCSKRCADAARSKKHRDKKKAELQRGYRRSNRAHARR